ncbi:MAG: hypothetical protein RSE04_09610, partial [Hydrogenoanaerobacterium sp.]
YPEHDNTTFLSYFNNANAVGSMIKNINAVWDESAKEVAISFDAGNFDKLEKGVLIEASTSLSFLYKTAGSPIDYSGLMTKPQDDPKAELIGVRPNERNTITVPFEYEKSGNMSVLIRPQAEGAATVLVPVACTGFDDSAPAKSQNVLSLVKPLKNEMFAPKADKRELRISMQLKDDPIVKADTSFEASLSCYILDAGGNKVRTIADNLPGRLNAIWSNGVSGKKYSSINDLFWDGKNDAGDFVENGTYAIDVTVNYGNNNVQNKFVGIHFVRPTVIFDPAPTTTFNIKYSGGPLANATVLMKYGDETVGSAITNAKGMASFNLSQGTYNYTVTATGIPVYSGNCKVGANTNRIDLDLYT